MSWFSRLKSGLTKTTTTITEGITKVFTHKTLDQDALDELEIQSASRQAAIPCPPPTQRLMTARLESVA